MREVVGSDVVRSSVVGSSEGDGLFTKDGYRDLEMLGTILHDCLCCDKGEHDFSYKDYVSLSAKKYSVDEDLISELGIVFYLYMERKGVFKE